MHRTVVLTRLVGLGVFSILCSTPSPADATPIHWPRAFVQAGAGLFDTGIIQDTGRVLGADTVGPVSVTRTDPGSGATSLALASVVDGTLHAFASGVGGGPAFAASGAGGTALAQSFDTFVPISATLAAGTLVSFSIDQQVSYTLSSSSACGSSGGAAVYAFTSVNGAVAQNGALIAGAVKQFQDGTCDTSDFNNDRSGILQAFIGQEFVVETNLYAFGGGTGAGGFGSADAGNSFRLVLTPLGDFRFSTASGNTYQALQQTSPVPEPASLVLVGSGLVALGRRHWRRSRRA